MNSDPTNQTALRSAFFDEADLHFWLWDKDLNLIDVNDATLRTFHFTREDIIGKNICEISPDCKPSGRYDQYMEVIRTGVALKIDEAKAHPSLGNLYFRLKAFKVGDGLGSVTKDITDLKETIEELETFMYKSSHDMRSPIASILGLVDLAGNSLNSAEESKQFYQIVKDQTMRLDSILQKLADTMRIRKGDKIIHQIDFRKILDDVLSSLTYMQGFKEVTITTAISSKYNFYTDRMLLISLFQNLIDNAIKYKRAIPDSYINISIADQDGGVEITVADNGIGIPEHLQKEVFKMFFRGTVQASGSGLGLYTVNHTLKRLGGTIEVEGKEGVGTTFKVFVPNEGRHN